METYEKNGQYGYHENGVVLAEIDYEFRSDDTIAITHTFVDPSLRGQGIASRLVEHVVALAEQNHWSIIPVCSYAVAYFEKHPSSLVKID